jgi:hypothetical protein
MIIVQNNVGGVAMKCNDCKDFNVHDKGTEKDNEKAASGICAINNAVCDPEDDCKTGLLDKTGVI